MYHMHKEAELCDATLNVDGQEIKVHKVGLKWYSFFYIYNYTF